MKKYIVTIEILLSDDSSHPRKWINDVIYENLEFEHGEDIVTIDFELVEE